MQKGEPQRVVVGCRWSLAWCYDTGNHHSLLGAGQLCLQKPLRHRQGLKSRLFREIAR